MPIPVACECGAKFAAQDRLAGKSVKCPKCSRPIVISASGNISAKGSVAQPKPKTPAGEPGGSIGSILDEFGIEASKTGVRCPECGADMKPEAIVCVKCGYHVKTGKKVASETDATAAQRREAMFAERRKVAEKADKVSGGGGGGRQSLGGVFEASTAILIHPSTTFAKLSPYGGVYEAFEYAFSAALAIGLYYLVIFGLYFFAMPLAAINQDPEQAEQIGTIFTKVLLPGFAAAAAIFAVIYAITVTIVIVGQGSLMAAVAHLILKHVGHSELPWTATLKVFVYNMGAMYVLSIVPCLGIAAPIWCLITTVIGLSVMHKVNGGVALLAWFVGAVATVAVFLAIYLVAGAMLLALLTMLAPPGQFPGQ